MKTALATCCLILALAHSPTQAQVDMGLDQWSEWQAKLAQEKLLQNISPADAVPGTVVAASSRENPNYYYHWVRDAALTLLTIQKLAEKEPSLWKHVEDFAKLSRSHQLTNAPGGLGEVKFHVDGSPFTAPWGRPQNDGPAIRALVLTQLANYWISTGRGHRVRQELYDGAFPTNTVLKADLEYVSHYWTHPDFDLWEEVQGEHFFTRILQRRTLIEGAKLARRLGDEGAASWYSWQANLMGPQINDHWDESLGLFKSTMRRVGGVDYKQGIDSSVVLGILAAAREDDNFLPLTDPRLSSSVEKLTLLFTELYPINQKNRDIAPGIGRYPEDRYDGYGTNRQGHAWYLITAAFAQYCYDLGQRYYYLGEIKVQNANGPFLARAFSAGAKVGAKAPKKLIDYSKGMAELLKGEVITRAQNEEQFFQIINGLKSLGDSFLKRIQLHASNSGDISEQFNRYTGKMQGAENLTWSYANFLEAIMSREKLVRLEEIY